MSAAARTAIKATRRLLVTCICFWVPLSLAAKGNIMPTVAPSKSAGLSEPYYWYDAHRKRTVWLSSGLVAEFKARPSSQSPLTKAYPRAKVYSAAGIRGAGEIFVRIWELERGVTAQHALIQLKSVSGQDTQYSPVFYDGPATTGQMRALPGNVIVYLDPAWNGSMVDQWIAGKGLQIVKQLDVGPNVFLLKTDAGLTALQLANNLYESGEVVAAFPDWWQEAVMK
jgi:hypothetical protein